MKVLEQYGRKDVAIVYVAELASGKVIEFVESLTPPYPRDRKWVLIVSTLAGCPIGCKFCDAGGNYRGRLTAEEITTQIEYLVAERYPQRHVPSLQWKIQFARMGEPAFNSAVLDVLRSLPTSFDAPGLMPSVSTIAPIGRDTFFTELLEIKNEFYSRGRFQLQFSLHSTDSNYRDELIPIRKWDFETIANYGKRFVSDGDRKVTLNFIATENSPIDPDILARHFDPRFFLVKITPLNPTYAAKINKVVPTALALLQSGVLAESFRRRGFETIISIGELEENSIGSNCGQYARKHSLVPITEITNWFNQKHDDSIVPTCQPTA